MAVVGAPILAAKNISLRGAFYTRTWRGLIVASVWPRTRGKLKNAAQRRNQERLKDLVTAVRYATPDEVSDAINATRGTPLLWRDLLTVQYSGHMVVPVTVDGKRFYPATYTAQVLRALDTLTTRPSGPIYRATDAWRANIPGPAGSVFTSAGPGQNPLWT